MILQEKIKIYSFDNQNNLYQRVMFIALNQFEQVLNLVIEGYPGESQTGKSSYYKRGAPESGKINEAWPNDKLKVYQCFYLSYALCYL